MTCLHNNITKGEKMNSSKEKKLNSNNKIALSSKEEKKTFENLLKSSLVTITIRSEPIKLSECIKEHDSNNNPEENNEL